LDELNANAAHYLIHRNRRGHIRYAIRKERMSLSPLSRRGESFRQLLEAGPVWALRGTPGSERATAAA
jgi:hypothetical protein